MLKVDINKSEKAYIGLYSLSKNWISNRRTLKLSNSIDNLYLLFHTVIQKSYETNKTQIQALIQRDEKLITFLMKDLDFFKDNKKLENIIFDIVIEVTKVKKLEDDNEIRFEKIINKCYTQSVNSNDFLRNISGKYLLS